VREEPPTVLGAEAVLAILGMDPLRLAPGGISKGQPEAEIYMLKESKADDFGKRLRKVKKGCVIGGAARRHAGNRARQPEEGDVDRGQKWGGRKMRI